MTGVVLLAVPVKDGVALLEGDAGEFNVTLGAAASAVNITGEAIAPPTISGRIIARRANTLTRRRALTPPITLPPSRFQTAGKPTASPRKLGYASITHKPLMTQFGGVSSPAVALFPQFAGTNRDYPDVRNNLRSHTLAEPPSE
jgi:hypothetical protein